MMRRGRGVLLDGEKRERSLMDDEKRERCFVGW